MGRRGLNKSYGITLSRTQTRIMRLEYEGLVLICLENSRVWGERTIELLYLSVNVNLYMERGLG